MPPGTSTVTCSQCRKKTEDKPLCGSCRAPRVTQYTTLKLIWAINAVITSMWVMHDCIFGFVGLAK